MDAGVDRIDAFAWENRRTLVLLICLQLLTKLPYSLAAVSTPAECFLH